jgi:cysteine desulfurase family protein (TIGR01976 family)
MAESFDVGFARSYFPALSSEWALFDNAGGSVAPRPVIERVGDYMTRLHVQLGASYALSQEATERVRAGQRAAAELVNASEDEVILGPSTTMNAMVLASALAPGLRAGDEIVVTNLDHEANIGAWRRLEARGAVLKEWRFNPDTCALETGDLDRLLTDRTRLVCFTHCSNFVGTIHDVAAITKRVHQAGALVCVDGVAFAPHRRVDVAALDVDFYLLSLYKVYGPHLGLLYGKRAHLLALPSQNHFFLDDEPLPYRFEPGNVNHELTASLPGILEYLDALHDRLAPGAGGDRAARLGRVFARIAEHEERLAGRLLDFLRSKRGVRVIGQATADRATRAPTIAFTVPGRDASEIPPELDRARIAVRYGHFYAYRAIRDLGLLERGGVVRASMVHYNTEEEVDRLIRGLDAAIAG